MRTNKYSPYNPKEHEEKIYRLWEKSGVFKPKIRKGMKPFVISMPPPNVTAKLHIGHGLVTTLEDIMIRYHRMKGEPVLWLPGTDHAGIATQNVVERELAKEGKTKEDLGREKFLRRIWQWVNKHGDEILKQLKRLGASADWSRSRFTLDAGLSLAVKKAFDRLKKEGLVYRGEYLVNLCVRCGTAVADDEVEYEEEKGKLWYLRYPLKSGRGFIEVATTRPETMLGDTAVAVHPTDKRYRKLIGRKLLLPLTKREIPIIADKVVDKGFGTGAVKVTPAHDKNDYEIGLRHNLPTVSVIGPNGRMTKEAGKGFAALKVAEARRLVLERLREKKLLVREVEITHSVGRCYRCKTPIEPQISKQWFVKMKPLAGPALKAVKEGRIKFIPKRFEKVYSHWLTNIRDWCISRQIWWGHPIPVKGEKSVLDTWFSSALWPFSTLGWPKETPDYKRFFPTTVMETGYDIIFFWVARMIMMSLKLTGKVPFETVYLHGLIRDERGRKMSKSLGNVIDPTHLIDQYGADAVRWSLIIGNTPGNDLNFSEERAKSARNFVNKLWNIARFIELNQGKTKEDQKNLSLKDKEILKTTAGLVQEIGKQMENFRFSLAAEKLYDFTWHTFADKYIETSKNQLAQGGEVAARTRFVLRSVFADLLRLLHPFTPFITEIIWQKLKLSKELLIAERWPK